MVRFSWPSWSLVKRHQLGGHFGDEHNLATLLPYLRELPRVLFVLEIVERLALDGAALVTSIVAIGLSI